MTERFTLLSELGRGGMGIVWCARDEETGTIVALKLLRETYAEDPDYVTRFEREFQAGDADPLAQRGRGARFWRPREGALVGAQGLADAHTAGVVHRDV